MKNKKIAISTIILVLAVLCISCGKPVTTYKEVDYGLTPKQLKSKMNKEASEIKENGGMKDYIYNEITCYDYPGTMVYHFSADGSTLMASEWTGNAGTEEEGQTMYEDIAAKLTGEHGEGVSSGKESDGFAMTTWEYDENTTTLSYSSSDGNNIIKITNIENADK